MNIPYGLQRSGYDVGSFKYNKHSQKKVYFKLMSNSFDLQHITTTVNY